MSDYELAPGAELDLLDIALYTIKKWGVKQADRYEAALEDHFIAIGQSEAHTRVVFEHWPELQLSRCEHHYTFSLQRADAPPLILAIFHEKMDLMARLRERLDLEGLQG